MTCQSQLHKFELMLQLTVVIMENTTKSYILVHVITESQTKNLLKHHRDCRRYVEICHLCSLNITFHYLHTNRCSLRVHILTT